ncbi:unnamed protein product [Zymoseptoria tritici ST99CH_3D1]|nr:unnamed protein product [Zymoseptoria tritici ST99CH_3D1]
MAFADLSSQATLKPRPFKAQVSDEDLSDFKQLLRLSKIGPNTYENQSADVKDFTHFGISRQWLSDAKQGWESSYDWRKTEAWINSYPNFTVPIVDKNEDGHGTGFVFDIHFIALFSNKIGCRSSPPSPRLAGQLSGISRRAGRPEIEVHTPETLPFHVIVPSLPGYGYSSGPPLDRDFTTEGMALLMNKLMLGIKCPECKAVHLHLCIGQQGELEGLTDKEKKGMERYSNFDTLGNAYAREHGTRPSTIGLVLSASPISLLAWVGEKFLQWSDTSPSTAEILDSVTLYWFSQSFPRAIYPYRQFFGANPTLFHNDLQYYIQKPLGYPCHPQELAPVPRKWVAETGNLVWYREHESGGHFAAMEKPETFVKDIEEFVKEVWPEARKRDCN